MYAEAKLHCHWRRVTKERHHLAEVIAESRRDPEQLFFCEIDGMDSAKTLVPRPVHKDKNTLPEFLLKLHVTCVKYDGTRPDNVYLYTEAFPHDSANTVTIMYEEILKVISMVVVASPFLLPCPPQCLARVTCICWRCIVCLCVCVSVPLSPCFSLSPSLLL